MSTILTTCIINDMNFVFLHLLFLWTCAFVYTQEVNYFSLIHTVYHSDKMYEQWHEPFFSFSTFNFRELVHSLIYAQMVSYFSLHNTEHSDNVCNQWHEICFSLSSLATFVNLYISLCSACKLLLAAAWHLSFCIINDMNLFFSTCYVFELVHWFILRR